MLLFSNLPFPCLLLLNLRVVGRCHGKKPTYGWVKLNTNDCAKGNPGRSGIGGVFRDAGVISSMVFVVLLVS